MCVRSVSYEFKLETFPYVHANKKSNFHTNKENLPRLWGPFWTPKSTQHGSRNDSNIKTIFKSEKVDLQEPLGAVLS